MKSAVITGATGAIGSALIKNLTDNGVSVLVLCRRGSARNENILQSPLVKKVYCSLDELNSLESSEKYEVFYHFGWAGTFGSSRNDMYLQNENVKYSLDAVAAAHRLGCKTFIGAGSQAEYGRVEGILKPDTPVKPENGYGIAKLCAGQMTREFAHSLGLKHVWVRILSVYGERDGAQTMVASTLEKLKCGQIAEFTAGEQLWDYLYSGDAAEAFRLIAEKGVDGKTYVLGGGSERPLKEYIAIMAKLTGGEKLVRLGAVPYAERQVMRLCADISELTRDTGWKPKVSFEQGIKNILK